MFEKDIHTKIAFAFIAVGLLYCSGLAISVGTTSVVKVGMIALCMVGCYILSPEFEVYEELTAVKIIIGSTVIGAILSFVRNIGSNIWLDPVMLIGMMIASDMLTDRVTFYLFRKVFGTVMAWLSIIAVLVSFFVERGLRIPSYSFVNSNGVKYNTIFICSWFSDNPRLMGPFWEPGLFASCILYALVLETVIFKFEKDRMWVLIALIVGILASKSTAGYLLLALVLFIWFQRTRQLHIAWDLLVILLVIVGYYFQAEITSYLVNLNPDVFWKLQDESTTGNTRIMSPLICLYVFFEKPLCGSGMSLAIERFNIIKKGFSKKLSIDSLTTTNVFFLAAFGIWGIGYTIGWIWGVMNGEKYPYMTRILLLVLFTIILNKEPHTNIMLTYVILFYLCKNETI